MRNIKSYIVKSVSSVVQSFFKKQVINSAVVKSVGRLVQRIKEKLKYGQKNVNTVKNSLQDIVIKQNTAQTNVENIKHKSVKIISKKPIGKCTVYNLSTGTHTYVANDCIVHNCDTVSMLSVMNPWKPSEEIAYEFNNVSQTWEELDDLDAETSSYVF